MQPGKPGNRGIRGIRHSLTGGMVIGRKVQGGRGAPQLLSIYDLQQILNSAGGFPNASPTPINQLIQKSVDAAHEVQLLSGVPGNILQFNLPNGVWDISANVTFDPTMGSFSTFTSATVAISPTSGVIPPPPNGGGYVGVMASLSPSKITTLTTAVMRVSVTVPVQPWWLVAEATFT